MKLEVRLLSDSIVSIRHVDKWYGENHVVKDMNLEIRQGESLTLLGPSKMPAAELSRFRVSV